MGGHRKKSKKRSAASSPSIRPPDTPFEFFVDECIAFHHVAAMLRAENYVAHVPGADPVLTGTVDVDWLPFVGTRHWILITKDKNIRKREIELRAMRASRVNTFVLTGAGLTGAEQARVVKEALPAMLRLLRRRSAHFIARITAESSVQILEFSKYIRDAD
jgi:hypothetical protein